ncbi:MAG: substrate-binding domain-containing protein [Verrucomicrobia bacterium]|nr:substrate-binding domain-containing protein [Kiritimatiellia bacterium]MCP5488145.1 substrate-binding domain-containing protein [Verrucomicrobiota bacterium]
MYKRVLFSTKWYEMRVHQGVLDYAQRHGWDVISSHHMPESAFNIPALDGQIVEIGPNDRRRRQLTEAFPGPVVGLEDFGAGLEVPRVHTDNYAVGCLAAEHFLERGFRRFATLCRADYAYVRDRLRGFHDTIGGMNGGLPCLDIKLKTFWSDTNHVGKEYRASSLQKLLAIDRPAGVFCVDDDDAAGLIRSLIKRNVSIPEEIAVVGVNNDPLTCPYGLVPITSIDPGFENIGYRAAELLDRMMQGKHIPPKTHLVPPRGLVVRRSSDIRAVEDLQVARALRFIWDHPENRKAVADIAAHVKLPIRTLQWRFNKAMGYSLQDEVTKLRIERIKERLIQSDKSIRQIADEMDFSSVQYLIRLFRKETGVSPLKFRRQHKPNPPAVA